MDEKKVREAIKALKITIDIGKQKIKYNKTFEPKNDNEPIEKSVEHAKTAIEALEKQLPKNILISGKSRMLTCPVCRKFMGFKNDEEEKEKYCDNCGQRLD